MNQILSVPEIAEVVVLILVPLFVLCFVLIYTYLLIVKL